MMTDRCRLRLRRIDLGERFARIAPGTTPVGFRLRNLQVCLP